MTFVVIGLVALAAVSLGLRATAVFVSPTVHPVIRLIVATAAGALITAVILELSENFGVLDAGIGLLISLSPVGVFDLVKWWYRWGK